MNDYSPGALLRLSMSLKHIQPAGHDHEALQDLRQASRIIEALSCLSNPDQVVESAIEHATMVKDIVSQRKTETVIERRIREGLRSAALKASRRGLSDAHPIHIAQVRVAQALVHARGLVESQVRKEAFDQAERSLHGLRSALAKSAAGPGGPVNENARQAALDWAASDPRDLGAFDRYLVQLATSTPAPVVRRRAGMATA